MNPDVLLVVMYCTLSTETGSVVNSLCLFPWDLERGREYRSVELEHSRVREAEESLHGAVEIDSINKIYHLNNTRYKLLSQYFIGIEFLLVGVSIPQN